MFKNIVIGLLFGIALVGQLKAQTAEEQAELRNLDSLSRAHVSLTDSQMDRLTILRYYVPVCLGNLEMYKHNKAVTIDEMLRDKELSYNAKSFICYLSVWNVVPSDSNYVRIFAARRGNVWLPSDRKRILAAEEEMEAKGYKIVGVTRIWWR